MGKLDAIWIKRAAKGPMDPVSSVETRYGIGLTNNADQKGKRQITIIEKEVWLKLQTELNTNFPATFRRANLMISGVALQDSRGRVLKVGSCLFRINGETRPCYQMDEVHSGLQAAMATDWRGGVYAEVLEDGIIRTGDTVEWYQTTVNQNIEEEN